MNALVNAVSSSGFADVWTSTLADAAVKGLVVLIAAFAVAVLLRRRAASARHLVWTLSMAALVLLPALSAVLPRYDVPIPGQPLEAVGGVVARALVEVEEAPPAPMATPRVAVDPRPRAESPSPASSRVIPPVASPQAMASRAPVPAPVAERLTAPEPAPIPWAAWALLVWAAGAAAVALPYLVSTVLAWRLARRARPLDGQPWAALLSALRRRLHVDRPVELLWGGGVAVPMTWGVLRPRILLPAEADAWPAARREVVLLHELAHVKRGDVAVRTLSRLACALHWFNPLAHLAARRLEVEREKACDDIVLEAGTKPSDYADQLLAIARGAQAPRLAAFAAIAMAQRPRLEGRLLAILDGARRRGALRWWAATLSLCAVTALLIPLAIVHAGCASVDESATAGARSMATPPFDADRPTWHALVQTVQKSTGHQVGPNVAAWADEGGPASVTYFNGVLVVNQTPAGHKRVADVLRLLDKSGAIKADVEKPFSEGTDPAAVAEMHQRLAEKVDLDFQNAPLVDVLTYLAAAKPELGLVIDPQIESQGIDLAGYQVSLKATQVPVASALGLLLGDELGYGVEPNHILITLREGRNTPLLMGVYAVRNADGQPLSRAGLERTTLGDELVRLIANQVGRQIDRGIADWSERGGLATAAYLNGVLIVTQTARGHERIGRLLTLLSHKGALPKDAGQSVAASTEPDAVLKTCRLLDQPFDLAFTNVPLSDVLKYLGNVQDKLDFVVDPAIAEGGIDLSEQRISLNGKKLPVALALDLILGDELAYRIEQNRVVITTPDRTSHPLRVVAYKTGL